MPDFKYTSSLANFGTSFNGRNYDDTKVCLTDDKQGHTAEEHVSLDEVDNYNADMLDGFRNITDSLLVFASLFSVVVTVFITETSRALQTDNTHIMVSLLFENNQLLRAAGNATRVSAVPEASLGPASATYTPIDVLVNGLFFASLSLSLSTALLTLLAKQWIQAYTAFVPGNETRALIHHFRFEGLMKWKLGDIIEYLPLILHASIAIFLVGLALYVSQFSSAICRIVSGITGLTFIFYCGTSMLPVFDISCPYRIPFMFSLAQSLLFAFRATKSVFLYFGWTLTGRPRCVPQPWMSRQSLKVAEQNEVFNKYKVSSVAHYLAWDHLGGKFSHSSNHSVQGAAVQQQQSGCGVDSSVLSSSSTAIMSNAAIADSSSTNYGHSENPVAVHSIASTQVQSSSNLTSSESGSAPSVSIESSKSGANTSENENRLIGVSPSFKTGAQSPQPATTKLTEDGHQILFYVKALYDYTASINEEFDFKAEDIIAVTHTPEDGWWSGELLDEKRRQHGRHVFPSNFVTLCYGKQVSEGPACSF